MRKVILAATIVALASSSVEKSTDDIVKDIQNLLDEAPATPLSTTASNKKSVISAAATIPLSSLQKSPPMSLLNTQQAPPMMQRSPQLRQQFGRNAIMGEMIPAGPFSGAIQQPPQQMPMRFQQQMPMMQQQQNWPQGGMMQRPLQQQMQPLQPLQQNMVQQQQPSRQLRPSWQPPQNHNVFAPKDGIPPPSFLETKNQGQMIERELQGSTKVFSYHHRNHLSKRVPHQKLPNLRSMGLPAHLQDPGYDYKEISKQKISSDLAMMKARRTTEATSLVEENNQEMLDTSIATDGLLQRNARVDTSMKNHEEMTVKTEAQAKAQAEVQNLMESKLFNYAERAQKVTEPGLGGSMSMYESNDRGISSPINTMPIAESTASSTSLGSYNKEQQIQAAERWLQNKRDSKKEEETLLSSAAAPFVGRFRATVEKIESADNNVDINNSNNAVAVTNQLQSASSGSGSYFYELHGAVPNKASSTNSINENNENPVNELKHALNVVEKQFDSASLDAKISPSDVASSTPRFARSTATTTKAASTMSKSIELPTYSNGSPLSKSVDLPKYDNTQPLRHENAVDASSSTASATSIRFKARKAAVKFPDANKLKWHGWVTQRKERVKERIQRVLHK
jgi:hypothetical protein